MAAVAGRDGALAVVAKPASKSGKREGYLSWDEYFMSVAFLTAMRSKDPSTQVGACIVNAEERIVGVGYNGFPSGIPDEALPWEKTSEQGVLETKYPYVCHAELNAVLNKNVESCKGCRLYSTLFPCCECAKVIIQAGIRCVIFASDKNREQDVFKASKRLFELAGVKMVSFVPKTAELRIPLRYPGDEGFVKSATTKALTDETPSGTPDAKRRRCSEQVEGEDKKSGQELEAGEPELEHSPTAATHKASSKSDISATR